MADPIPIAVQRPTVWWLSQTLWSQVILMALPIAGLLGLDQGWITAHVGDLTSLIITACTLGAGIYGLFGRINAKGPLSLSVQPHDSKIGIEPAVTIIAKPSLDPALVVPKAVPSHGNL